MHRSKRSPGAAPPSPAAPSRTWLPWALLSTAALVAVVVAPALWGRGTPGPPLATSAAASSERAERGLVVTPPRLDVGDVYMDVSEVPLRFEVTNASDQVAVITYLETSCDCTRAAIVTDGREGPRFAMRHDTPPGTYDWRAVLAPGETVVLMVYYDPQAHGVLTPEEAPAIHGPVTRVVRLHSNDPREPVVDLRIDLNQRH